MTGTRQPRTAAGRALLTLLARKWPEHGRKAMRDAVADAVPTIEAEAAAPRPGERALREAAQAYIDWRDQRLAQWRAVAECGHSDPFCPEMEVIRSTPLDHDEKLDDAIRASLAHQQPTGGQDDIVPEGECMKHYGAGDPAYPCTCEAPR